MELPPIRLCGQAFLFAWHMCLFFSPIVLAFSIDPAMFLVTGRLVFLAVFAVSLWMAVLVRRSKPSTLTDRTMVLLGVLFASGGSALAVFGSSTGVASVLVTACGYALAGLGDAFLLLSFGRLYGELSVKLSMRVVPLAMVFAAVLYAVVANGMPVLSVPVVVALPVACGAVLLYDLAWGGQPPERGSDRAGNDGQALAAAVSDADKAKFTKWKISSYTAVLWFSFGVMWVLAVSRIFGDGRLLVSFSLSVSAIVVIVSLVVACLTYMLKLPTVKTFWIFAPLTIAGVSVVAVVDSNAQVFAFAMVFAARSVAEMQLITHFAAICRRRGYCSTMLFGCGFAVLSAGEALGLLVGLLIAPLESAGLTMFLLVCANVIVIVVILSIMRVNATFQKAELEALAMRQVRSNAPEKHGAGATTEQVVSAWAQLYSLSAREGEVAVLLLSGRNVPAIAEMLSISQSTVQTHVKHIYEKTDVHTRQELIDLRDRHQDV